MKIKFCLYIFHTYIPVTMYNLYQNGYERLLYLIGSCRFIGKKQRDLEAMGQLRQTYRCP